MALSGVWRRPRSRGVAPSVPSGVLRCPCRLETRSSDPQLSSASETLFLPMPRADGPRPSTLAPMSFRTATRIAQMSSTGTTNLKASSLQPSMQSVEDAAGERADMIETIGYFAVTLYLAIMLEARVLFVEGV